MSGARGTALKLVPPALAKIQAPVKPSPSLGARLAGHIEAFPGHALAVGKLAAWIAVPCVLVLTALTMLFHSSLARVQGRRSQQQRETESGVPLLLPIIHSSLSNVITAKKGSLALGWV